MYWDLNQLPKKRVLKNTVTERFVNQLRFSIRGTQDIESENADMSSINQCENH
jgi:hypothetical protein